MKSLSIALSAIYDFVMSHLDLIITAILLKALFNVGAYDWKWYVMIMSVAIASGISNWYKKRNNL